MKTQTFSLSNLTCPSCEDHIEELEKKLVGVDSVNANYKKSTMNVVYDEAKTSSDDIVKAVEAMGYGAKPSETKSKKGFWQRG